MPEKQVVIVGGGLAGLISALALNQAGIPCTVIEKNRYPFHRVCGEYVSNEVVPYLTHLGAYPESLQPSRISRLQLTSTNGKFAELPLEQGGFGISRYAFDHFLYELARRRGVDFHLHTEATAITYDGARFHVETPENTFPADIVIAGHGKRSLLDRRLDRKFLDRHSPYVGVKYHIRLPDFPEDLIALHNFSNGYCGVSRVENDVVNLCYLTHRDNVRAHRNLRGMEEAVLWRNPFLRDIFTRASFLFDKPETVNEISFRNKGPVEGHLLFCGDSAGMITPLCGNGMAMAIHSAKLAAECVIRFFSYPAYSRQQLEQDYARQWTSQFAFRIQAGRMIQGLFGSDAASHGAVLLAKHLKPAARQLVRLTHGKPF
jgi:flavin-dependent dehydrogenase